MSSSARRIDLAVGGEVRLPLTGAGSVGWEWRVSVTGDAATATIESAPPADAPAGGSFPLFVVVTGRHPGRAAVHLALVRDPGRPPRETIDLDVIVAG